MTIGELARRAGVKISTLRFYERQGFLAPARRTQGGYREFDENDVARVRYLKRGQQLGFALAELGALTRLSDEGLVMSGEIADLGRQKLEDIQERIDDLRRMQSALAELLAAQCIEPDVECPIIAALAESPALTA
jgi:MerR family mercuric resistance operon transcriptional regulator